MPVQRGAQSGHSIVAPLAPPGPQDVTVCDHESGFICFVIWPRPGKNLDPTGALWGPAGQGLQDTGEAPSGVL